MNPCRCRNQEGWTLIELMIGIMLSATVAAAGYAVLASSEKSVTANQQTVETQQNVRMALDYLFQDIRQAGFGMNGAVGLCPTAVVPADHTPAGQDRGPDRISLVVPVGNPVGTPSDPAWILASDTTSGFNSIALPTAAVVTNMQTAAGSLATQTISIGGAVTTTVTAASGASLTVAAVPAPVSMKRNSPVYVLQCITYQVIPPPDAANLARVVHPVSFAGWPEE